jgi:hypothetical protein
MTGELDLSFLLNKPLKQIRMGEFQVILDFPESISVSAHIGLIVRRQQQSYQYQWLGGQEYEDTVLFTLLEKKITSYSTLNSEQLLLVFEDGTEIVMLTDKRYDSYTVCFHNDVYVV